MSTLRVNNLQIGQSGTAAQNFTLYQPTTPDGTLRLAVGNSGATTGDVLSVSSAGLSVTGTLTSTGVNTFPAGSASAPSITTTGDTNTGVFFPAADTIAFTEGGAEAMRIDSSSRVLIGTTTSTTGDNSQYSKFQVIGNNSSATDRGAIVNLGHSAAATSITTGELIGGVLFTDTGAGEYGAIQCQADGTAGTGDYPGRLMFFTTADGASAFTERMRISADGTIKTSSTISVGGATPSTSGAGITFPATQSASSDANTLDDYEEGTFTVSSLTPNTSGTITISTSQNVLKYTKIGRVVYINGFVAASGVSSPVGFYITLAGLPFNVTNSSSPTTGANYQSGVAIFYYSNTTGTGQATRPITVPNNGGTSCFWYVDASTVTTSTEIYININYAV